MKEVSLQKLHGRTVDKQQMQRGELLKGHFAINPQFNLVQALWRLSYVTMRKV